MVTEGPFGAVVASQRFVEVVGGAFRLELLGVVQAVPDPAEE
jgi:hypothetical protein